MTNVFDESTFAMRWLLRFASGEVQQAIAELEPIELLATRLRELFLREVCKTLQTKYMEDPTANDEWLELELASELIALDSDYGAGESLLALLSEPIGRIDWQQVAETIRTPGVSDLETLDDDNVHSPKRGGRCRAIVGHNPETGEVLEFASVKSVVESDYCPRSTREAIKSGQPYKGLLWTYADDRTPELVTSEPISESEQSHVVNVDASIASSPA